MLQRLAPSCRTNRTKKLAFGLFEPLLPTYGLKNRSLWVNFKIIVKSWKESMRITISMSLLAFLVLFSTNLVSPASAATRWYSPSQVEQGSVLFQTNCAGCHGNKAQGIVVDWRKPLANGSLPAPPLNGSAHAWHHKLSDLRWVISTGSINRGGTMPGFKTWMSDQEQLAAIAYFQNFWDDRTYNVWLNRGGLSK